MDVLLRLQLDIAQRIDEARGGESRSSWIRAAIAEKLASGSPPAVPDPDEAPVLHVEHPKLTERRPAPLRSVPTLPPCTASPERHALNCSCLACKPPKGGK